MDRRVGINMEDSKVMPRKVVRLTTIIVVLKMSSAAMVAIITRERTSRPGKHTKRENK
jgi:hypothetical protein